MSIMYALSDVRIAELKDCVTIFTEKFAQEFLIGDDRIEYYKFSPNYKLGFLLGYKGKSIHKALQDKVISDTRLNNFQSIAGHLKEYFKKSEKLTEVNKFAKKLASLINSIENDNKSLSTDRIKKDKTKEQPISEKDEPVFLTNHVTKLCDIHEFKICETLFREFLHSILNKDFFSAWNLLTPDFHSSSIWSGAFKLYENSFSSIDSSKRQEEPIVNFKFHTYRVEKISFWVDYIEIRKVYDLTKLLSSRDEWPDNLKWSLERKYHNRIVRRINSFIEGYSNGAKKELNELDQDLLTNYDFQRFLWMNIDHHFFHQPEKYLPVLKTEEKSYRGRVLFKFISNRWLIDHVDDLEPCYFNSDFEALPSRRRKLTISNISDC